MFLEGADSNLKVRLYAYSSRRRGSAELHEGSPSAARAQQEVGVTLGTSVVVGQGRDKLSSELSRIVAGRAKKGITPPLWDGHAGERIADVIQTIQ
jgi:hypothetical protein